MMNKCGSIRDLLGSYVDKELDPARADQVKRHLETCADCRRELAQIQELHRLAKSVEHPPLAGDYWDWHRHKVWRGIREPRRGRTPRFKPSFTWPRLAMAAGLAMVMVVVAITGWRVYMQNSPRVSPVASGRRIVDESPVAAAPALSGAKPPAAVREEAEPVAEAARTGKAGVQNEADKMRATAQRDAEKSAVGYAARGGGAAVSSKGRPELAGKRRAAPGPTKAAAEPSVEPAAEASSSEEDFLSLSKREGRIVSGPVLLEQPPLPDLDALDTGTVLLSVRTDSIGRVLGAAVRRTSGSARLDSVAVSQIRRSRFKAAVQYNRSVSSSFEYQYNFPKKQVRPSAEQKQQDKDSQPTKQPDKKQESKPKLKEKTKK